MQRDDFVYLHLSGHGAQQPQAKAGDETDGLDEIFLPSNIDKWINREEGVPNALIDNEIGAALDAIRDKGAFVWVVFDCCHSGTATRAAEVDDELERKVEFADLVGGDDAARAAAVKAYDDISASASRGFDENGGRKPAFNLTPTGAEPIARGKLVAFYAAQTVETTPEMPLPKGTPDAPRFGLFTFTILSKLAENPNVTYRQLGQAVLQQYSADGRTRPTPLVRGRTRRPRVRHRQDRRHHAMADCRQGRRRRRSAPACCMASPPAASSPSCRRRCRSFPTRSAISK